MAYFPMYVNLTGKKCVVCGGGKVALRKVMVLLDFDAVVYVYAKEICPEIRQLAGGTLFLCEREPLPGDLDSAVVVVAATNDRQINHEIAQWARERQIPVNAVDQTEDCSFIFSSYIKEQNLVASFSGGGNSPVVTQYLKQKEKEVLTPDLGAVNELLGSLRPQVKKALATEGERKAFYAGVLAEFLESGKIPLREDLLRKLM